MNQPALIPARELSASAESLAGQRQAYLETAPGSVAAVVDVIETFHNDMCTQGNAAHSGAFSTCHNRPCHAVRQAAYPAGVQR